MRDGFVKVAAVTPDLKVADVEYNTSVILAKIKECTSQGVRVIVFPELSITGYSCGDLFLQDLLLEKAKEALFEIAKYSAITDALIFVGLPFAHHGKLYNVAAAIADGAILGLVPKTFLPNYNEFYEARYFEQGMKDIVSVSLGTNCVTLMGTQLLFTCKEFPQLSIGAELCEDLWAPVPPSINLALAGATIIVNLSASDETTGKDAYRRELVKGQSARLLCGYIYTSAGEGESTQDVVYSGHNLITENGMILAESKRFMNETIISEIDVKKLTEERRRMSTFHSTQVAFKEVCFSMKTERTSLSRWVDPTPFVPKDTKERLKRCEEILMIQAMGLKKRLIHTSMNTAVVGISGGLDSTLALIVTVRAFDLAGLDRKGIYAITMPGFGTTDRTYQNAITLVKELGASFLEIPIQAAVNQHFSDIGHSPLVHDITYENAQARERTQLLMDVANQHQGMVIGTGDMSELALGWATYNGDHMSMYGVNASVPKSLVRHLVEYYADTCNSQQLNKVLMDVLDTPVSPELLPPKDGEIAQKTEDIVGPYELHDFFLYYMLRAGFTPKKVFRLAVYAFEEKYEEAVILKWMHNFYRRFFAQQFKRSCMPDGPKVGTIALSPRGDLRMPSDASAALWLKEIDDLVEGEDKTYAV